MDPLPMDYALSAPVTLIVVVEPAGLAPIFLGIAIDRLAARSAALCFDRGRDSGGGVR